MDVTSRKEALEQGLKRYFTGKPCKHGHITWRYVLSRKCSDCNKVYDKVKKREYYENNRDRCNELSREYKARNPSVRAATEAKRRAAKLQRTPTWLTEDMLSEIQGMYKESSEKLTPHHVDHIVPLQGELVSGLHVPWNLQVISAGDNLRKSNRC